MQKQIKKPLSLVVIVCVVAAVIWNLATAPLGLKVAEGDAFPNFLTYEEVTLILKEHKGMTQEEVDTYTTKLQAEHKTTEELITAFNKEALQVIKDKNIKFKRLDSAKIKRLGYKNYLGLWSVQPIYIEAFGFYKGLAYVRLDQSQVGLCIDNSGQTISIVNSRSCHISSFIQEPSEQAK